MHKNRNTGAGIGDRRMLGTQFSYEFAKLLPVLFTGSEGRFAEIPSYDRNKTF